MERLGEGSARREDKYLTFKPASEGYGIPFLSAKEIIGLMPFTPIPRVHEFIRGVINLRGKAIPVIDLRPDRRPGEGLAQVASALGQVANTSQPLAEGVAPPPYGLASAEGGFSVRRGCPPFRATGSPGPSALPWRPGWPSR